MTKTSTDSTATILLVDDEPDTLRMIARMLTRQGYFVVGYSSVEDVLDFCEYCGLTFDALLTDMDMGADKMNGWDLIQNLRLQGYDQPMVLWSGGDASTSTWTGDLGASIVLSKSEPQKMLSYIQNNL